MKITVHSLLGCAVLGAGLLGAACSRPASEHQSALAPALVSTRLTAASDSDAVFPLVRGTFAIGNRGGDSVLGTYTGTSTGFGRNSSLALQVTGGSGAFAGAAGSLVLRGTGAFAGEGTFALDGSGEVTLAGMKRAHLVVSLLGRSTAGCSPSQQIAISQSADGTMSRAGRVVATLDHTVENTGCVS